MYLCGAGPDAAGAPDTKRSPQCGGGSAGGPRCGGGSLQQMRDLTGPGGGPRRSFRGHAEPSDRQTRSDVRLRGWPRLCEKSRTAGARAVRLRIWLRVARESGVRAAERSGSLSAWAPVTLTSAERRGTLSPSQGSPDEGDPPKAATSGRPARSCKCRRRPSSGGWNGRCAGRRSGCKVGCARGPHAIGRAGGPLAHISSDIC